MKEAIRRPIRRNQYKTAFNIAMRLVNKLLFVGIAVSLIVWLFLVTL